MADMLSAIKQAAVAAVAAGHPPAVMIGTVADESPLAVNVDQRFTLTAAFLIVPESLTRQEISLRHSHAYGDGFTGEAISDPVVLRRGLEAGDKVLLLRVQGGQRYVILDRVVEP